MSAFIVSKATMDYVVTALADSKTCLSEATFAAFLRGDRLDADEVGRKLFALNERAVRGRYPSDPEYAKFGADMAKEYRWEPRFNRRASTLRRLCTYAKAVDCLHYQCNEQVTVSDELLVALERFSFALKAEIVDSLPEYREQPWDFPE